MNCPYTKNLFYKCSWCTEVYINPYSQRSLYHTHVYQHAWWRHYSDNGARGHEYIWTLKHTESSLVFLVWSGVSMIQLNQYHASEYNQSYYIWFLQANSGFVVHDWGWLLLYNPKWTVHSLSLIVHRSYKCWEVKQMEEFFLNDETYENDNTFFYIILEYDRPNLDLFLPRGPNIWLVRREVLYRNLQRLWNHLDSMNLIAICFQ